MSNETTNVLNLINRVKSGIKDLVEATKKHRSNLPKPIPLRTSSPSWTTPRDPIYMFVNCVNFMELKK